jgi:hypothetical protein
MDKLQNFFNIKQALHRGPKNNLNTKMKILVRWVPLMESYSLGDIIEYDMNLGLPEVAASFAEYIEKMNYQANLEEIKVSFMGSRMVYWLEVRPQEPNFNDR